MFSKIKSLFKKKEQHPEVDAIIVNIKSRIAKSNGYAIAQFSLLKPKENTDAVSDYLNKDCVNLYDFTISSQLDFHDLKKLCELNNIDLQVSSGWHSILINLLIELDAAGWDRKVSCIKEKYASLKFYTDSSFDEIIEKFEHISEHTCETCGEKGNKRYNTSWDYVACRKHYLENRGFIELTDNGFDLNGKLFLWKDIVDAIFEDLYTEKNRLLTLTFKSNTVEHQGWSDNKLYISNGTIGYGVFLGGIPPHFKNLDYLFLNEYRASSPCMICGFMSVYNHVCENCENDEWVNKENNFWDKEEYIKLHQGWWIEDEGPKYSEYYKNYLKDDSYKIIYQADETALD
jgi:hypothetical protein